jgi:hypothetical protein
MSTELEQQPKQGYLRLVLIVAILIAVPLGAAAVIRGRSKATTANAPVQRVAEEDSLREARDSLAREPDLATCKDAIGKVNNHLSQHPDLRSANLDAQASTKLREQFGLDSGDMAELESVTYTPLDARYLDECLLYRDAARSLDSEEVDTVGKPLRQQPLDRAAAAFGYIVRQIRTIPFPHDIVPPAFALRRAWGDTHERALAFLALLQQDRGPELLRGCVLMVPDKSSGKPKPWACGVIIGDAKKVYLFDLRLGLPLPGPDGKGVATLEEAIKNPAVLAQLDAGPEARYDVTPESARSAVALAYFPLTGLAPRTRHLQETLLTRALGARLAVDPADLDRIREAVVSSGAKGASVWTESVTLTRHFLPPEEGGIDAPASFALKRLPGFTRPDDPSMVKVTRLKLYDWTMVPWDAMPQEFNPIDFPITVGLGQRVRQLFEDIFTKPVREPGGARELALRGQYDRAVPLLVTEDSQLREWIARRNQEEDLAKKLQDWLKSAREAYALQLRAQNNPALRNEATKRVDTLWHPDFARQVYILLYSAAAGPRDAEVTYQLGLCLQEQAEQYQARIDLLNREKLPVPPADLEHLRQACADAKGWWERFAGDYNQVLFAPSARQNLGRIEAMLGNQDAAAAAWSDLRGVVDPMEALGSLYRAREARKHTASKQ